MPIEAYGSSKEFPMTRLTPVLTALLMLATCPAGIAHSQSVKGPLAVGVSSESPKDAIGILLGWRPEQTIENFKHFDQLFPVRTVPHGSVVKDLPAGEPIDPIVTDQIFKNGVIQPAGRKISIDQLMQESRITGVIALHHGKIVFERYAFGRTAQDRWVSNSAAKSMTSTLVGAAIKDGLIGSVEDPVSRYIPELVSVPAFKGVTLRHLMTMSSGLMWNEEYSDLTSDVALAGGADPVDGRSPMVTYAMKLKRAHPPGTVHEYQNIDADLVGIVLSRVLKGRTVSDYLSAKIWRPAGMEADANWLLDKAGFERGGCCVSARLRDYARFGLFIASGKADSELPSGWLTKATAPTWAPEPMRAGYGWFWWVRPDDSYEAQGAYGQSVTIYPKDDVVIAINSAGVEPGGIGLPRWTLLQALDDAAAGRPDRNAKPN
jgi:CubicO group peptidase (beta-lactamase class C family)